MKDVILTGDRPTGRLHLGHYAGSLKKRVDLQKSGQFEDIFIMIADAQAITDHAGQVGKIRENVLEVALDYLSCGLDPKKSTIFIQSQIPELCELTFYYMNLVTLARLQRNPTVKAESLSKGFADNIPLGFLAYPVSQAADITAFDARIVPVGGDQLPMIEQTREIVRSFNSLYGETLIEPRALLPENQTMGRLPGLDGKAKMSKTLGNAIDLADSPEEVQKKVMGMFTDPNHLRVEDPGNTRDNPVFIYLEVFSNEGHFEKFWPDYKNLDQLKAHYERGGLGDVSVKRFLIQVLEDILAPIRERRRSFEEKPDEVYRILEEGSRKARIKAGQVLARVRQAMGLEYFEKGQVNP